MLTKPAFECVGFTPRKISQSPNCGNCMNWEGKCKVRKILDELYEESSEFKVFNHMMRDNKGVRIE